MKLKKMLFALVAMMACFAPPAFAQNVAKIGDTEYATLQAAIGAATAGQTVTLMTDVNEYVKIDKSLTLDGADKTFKNRIELNCKSGSFTIKNVNFDSEGTQQHAIKSIATVKTLNIVDCTAKNYSYSLVYTNKDVTNLNVKNVTVEDMGYGVHSVRGTNVTIEDYKAINIDHYAVYVQNYSSRNVVLNNCTFEECETPLAVWERNQTYKITFNFKGVNEMGKADFCTSAMAKVVAAAQVGTKVYENFSDAFAATQAGDNFTLFKNYEGEAVTLPAGVTLYENGFTADNIAIAKPAVAKIGETTYETFAAAVAAAKDGDVITLLQDVATSLTIAKSVTVDGAEHTFTGMITANGKGKYVTMKNIHFNGNEKAIGYAVRSDNGNLIAFENCTATGYNYGLLYANKSNNVITMKDVLVENCGICANIVAFNNATFENVTVKNSSYGVQIQNEGKRNVTFTNCTMENVQSPVSIYEKTANTAKVYFTFKGENDFGAAFKLGKYAVVNGAVLGGTKVYPSLAEAVAASNDVKLIANTTGAGTVIDNDVTVDFAGYTYTVNKAVGSKGTETLGLQIKKDHNVTLKNGTLNSTAVVEGNEVKMLVQNYANLTVEDMNLVDATDHILYVLSNNCGDNKITGATNITTDAVAFDSYSSKYYTAPTVTVETTGTIAGSIEKNEGAAIVIKNGTYTMDVTEWCAAGYVCQANGEGTYGVTYNPAYGKVAKVGDDYYATLTDAVANAAANATVELIADINENVTLTKNVTIAGAGFNYTGTMSAKVGLTVAVEKVNFVNAGFSKSDKSTTSGNYTFKGCTFDGQGTYSRAIYVRGANKVVLEDCTAKGYDYFMYVPNALNNSITVKNVTVENCEGYAVFFNSGAGKATFENFTVKNTPTAIIYNNTANRALTLNNCAMENVGTAIRHTGDGDKNITCTFEGVNDLGDAAFSEYVVLKNAVLAGTKIYASLAEAVAADGNEVKLLGNSTGAGVVIDEDLTIDFNGKTYTFNGDAVGSSNTKSNGFQILKENKVTLMNGTLKVAEAAKDEFYILVQNYANLTVKNMNLDGTNLDKYSATDGDSYVLSNNSGEVVITGKTNITANNDGDKAFAFDACDKSGWGYDLPVVKVYTTGEIAGGIENSATIELYSGTYTMDVNEWCAEGYAATKGADNLWTVGKAIAQVGGQTFGSIQAAIDAAQNNETVTLIADVELSTANTVIQNDGYAVLVNVADKKVTIDLNGKNVAVKAEASDVAAAKGGMLLAVFHADTNGELILTDNTEDKSGAVVVNVNDAKVYSVFTSESQYTDKSESGKIIVNAGDYKTVGNLANAMFFADANEVITINGGNFYCDGASTGTPYPWMVNTLGNDVLHVVVKGGTFNVEINKQHRKYEVYIPNECFVVKNSDNTWTVCDGAVARVNGVSYATLAEAVEVAEAKETVTLVADATGAGVVIDKSITIDFGGNTYTFNKAVGSTNTETLGFQILKGTEVVLQNGTLTSTEVTEGKEVKVLVQNYADALTLEDMNLVDATEHILYALSNNSGETSLIGETNITTNAVAFDSYYSKSYTAPTVTVETTGKIEGAIEKNDGATIAISGGTFTAEILPEWCDEYYAPVQNTDDGTWTVEYRYIDEKTIVDGSDTEFVNEKEMTVGTLTYKRTFKFANKWQTLYVPFEIPVDSLNGLGYEVAYLYDVHNKVVAGEEIDPAAIESVHFVKITKGTLRASYPYIIRPTSEADLNLSLELENTKLYSTAKSEMHSVESSTTTTRYIFAGTYVSANRATLTGDDNIPCLAISNSSNSEINGAWQKMNATANLPIFRVFMYIVNKDGSPVIVTEEAAKAIKIRIVGEENEDGTTTIYDVEIENQPTVDYIYDLHGRRVMEPQKGGIYIVNGKKIVF